MSVKQTEKIRRRIKQKYNEKTISIKNIYADKAVRTCLMCGKRFVSRGPHNRRCQKCNQKIDQAAENTFYMPTVYNNEGGASSDFITVVE
jgi:tRNA(Ile2) C34 agmatinyltransferase TiaS